MQQVQTALTANLPKAHSFISRSAEETQRSVLKSNIQKENETQINIQKLQTTMISSYILILIFYGRSINCIIVDYEYFESVL